MKKFALSIIIALLLLCAFPAMAQDEFVTNTPLTETSAASPEPTATPTPTPSLTPTNEPTPIVVVDPPVDPPVEPNPGIVSPIGDSEAIDEAGQGIVGIVIQYLNTFLTTTPAAAAVVALLVGLLKFTPLAYDDKRAGFKGVHSNVIAFAVTALLWLIYVAAEQLGYIAQLSSVADQIAALSPSILGFVGTLFGARIIHEQSARRGISVLGYKTPSVKQAGQVVMFETVRPPANTTFGDALHDAIKQDASA